MVGFQDKAHADRLISKMGVAAPNSEESIRYCRGCGEDVDGTLWYIKYPEGETDERWFACQNAHGTQL
jgi:hypothetical protein